MGWHRYYGSNRYTGFYRRYEFYVVSLIYRSVSYRICIRHCHTGNTGIIDRYLPVYETLF
ncbi:hypothetical protein Hanom_Chr08g00751511 [Helianthus anomalus]